MRGGKLFPDETMGFTFRRLVNRIAETVFPDERASCLMCHRALVNIKTAEVESPIGELCLFCSQDVNRVSVTPLRRRLRMDVPGLPSIEVISAVPNQGVPRRVVRQWKYDGFLQATNWLARLVIEGIQRSGLNPAVDVVVPIPTTSGRLEERGYDHAAMLGRSVSNLLGVPTIQALAKRDGVEGARSQTGLGRQGRAASVRDAYVSIPGTLPPHAHVLLVDDIVTTGSTLQSAARALFVGHRSSVTAATIAWEE